MAELVDALGLGSSGFICAGSSPVLGTYFTLHRNRHTMWHIAMFLFSMVILFSISAVFFAY
jgi:hypothetical protein